MAATREITVEINGDAAGLMAATASAQRRVASLKADVAEILKLLAEVEEKVERLGPRG